MADYTQLVDQRLSARSIKAYLKDVERALDGLTSRSHQFFFGDRAVACQPIDILRWTADISLDHSRPEYRNIRNIILGCVESCEKKQVGSGLVFLSLLVELIKSPVIQAADGIAKDSSIVSSRSRRCSQEEAFDIVSSVNADSDTAGAISKIISSIGSNSTLHILSEPTIPSLVEIVRGYNFSAVIPEVFHSACGVTDTRVFSDLKVLVADGVIENMSEIEGLIMISHEKKIPLVIFARGFADDVQNTLGKNLAHGHLQVFPISVPLDITGARMLEDISIVVGSELISSLKGDLISAVKWEDLPLVDGVKINSSTGGVEIINHGTEDEIKVHRKNLRKERHEADQDVRRLIDVRLSCLQGSGARVNIGSEWGDLTGLYRDRIEIGVRMYRACARWGVIDMSSDQLLDPGLRRCMKRLSKISRIHPAGAVGVGIATAHRWNSYLRRIGGVVHIERRD